MRWGLVAVVAWAIYGLLLYGHARQVLGSCAFDTVPLRDHLFEIDAQRTERAFLFFSQLAQQSKDTPQYQKGTKERNELCMVISTVDRHGPRYLLQSAASILQGLTEQQKQTSELLIVNTDVKDKSLEYLADLELLRKAPGVEVIEAAPHVATVEADPFVKWLSKERDDYIYALNQCRKRNPKYVLLFEDDVWAANHWYARLLPNLHKLEAADGSDGEWAFVKLYMAVQYDDYDLYLHTRDILFFVSYGVGWGLTAIVAYLTFLIVSHARRHGQGAMPSLAYWSRVELKAVILRDWNTLVCAFFVCNIVAAGLAAPICIAKQSFSLTRKTEGIWPTISRCCAQAQLFKVGPLLDNTISCVKANDYRHNRAGVDLLVSDCAREVGGTVYENIPHLFQHIGIHSSSSVKRKQQDHGAWIPHMSVYFQEQDDPRRPPSGANNAAELMVAGVGE
jgi:hypothetical protein